MWAGSHYLLLMSRIWPKWWDVTSMVRLQKAVASTILALSLLLMLSCPLTSSLWWSTLPCWKMLYGETHTARNQMRPHPTAVRNWVLSTITRVSQKMDSSQLNFDMTAAQWETQGQRTQLSPACFPHPQKLEDNKCFKPLNLGITCYTAINNK